MKKYAVFFNDNRGMFKMIPDQLQIEASSMDEAASKLIEILKKIFPEAAKVSKAGKVVAEYNDVTFTSKFDHVAMKLNGNYYRIANLEEVPEPLDHTQEIIDAISLACYREYKGKHGDYCPAEFEDPNLKDDPIEFYM